MSEREKLMNFEEFRALGAQPFGEAVRQQLQFFRDTRAADEILRPGKLSAMGWAEWPANDPITAG